MEELIRSGAAVLIAASLIGGFSVLGKMRQRRRASPATDLAGRFGLPPGLPAIIYVGADVTGDEPSGSAVQLTGEGRRVVIHRLRAEADPELLQRLGIATLPSTVVIGTDHAVRAINPGVADADLIERQLA